jgi:hypothetical protein
VHKDAVTCIIEKHIKDPALVKRLVDAWDSAVDLGVTTAKASPAQKKKKTDRAIRLTSVRQATSVLLSQIGLIACKWCVYRGLHDCCLTTKKQFGQLGDSEQCCGLGKDHLTRAPPRNSHTHSHTHTYTKHRNTSGQDHPDVAASYNNIANIYDDQGKYEEALEMHTKSLDIKTRMYGVNNHLDVAASYMGLGIVYESLGKYEEALEMHSKSLDIKTRILGGDNHPDVATT